MPEMSVVLIVLTEQAILYYRQSGSFDRCQNLAPGLWNGNGTLTTLQRPIRSGKTLQQHRRRWFQQRALGCISRRGGLPPNHDSPIRAGSRSS